MQAWKTSNQNDDDDDESIPRLVHLTMKSTLWGQAHSVSIPYFVVALGSLECSYCTSTAQNCITANSKKAPRVSTLYDH